MYDIFLCQNHAQHLATIAGVTLLSIDLIDDSYAASGFLGADGHFRRALMAVDRVLQDLEIAYPGLILNLLFLCLPGVQIAQDWFSLESLEWSFAFSAQQQRVILFLLYRYADPPSLGKEYAELWHDVFLRNAIKTNGGEKSGQKLRDATRELIHMFNNNWWSTAIKHFCKRDGSCCRGSSDAERLVAIKDSNLLAILTP